jgi:hypothetical protein
MKTAGLAWLAVLSWAVCASAQLPSVRVYSGFQRIDPFGNVVSMDRARLAGVRPREILSPALGRNAHTVFHVAVTVPPGKDFALYVGQNPDGYLGIAMYREIYARHGDEWIPDALEPVTFPITGRLPETGQQIPGQTTVTFLMDVSAALGTEVRRTKLEPELYVDGQWIIYPMEARVVSAIVPEHKPIGVPLAPFTEPADRTARAAVPSYLCGAGRGDGQHPLVSVARRIPGPGAGSRQRVISGVAAAAHHRQGRRSRRHGEMVRVSHLARRPRPRVVLARARFALSGELERRPPAQAFKPGVIPVGCDPLAAGFDRQRREPGVLYQVPRCLRSAA